MPDVLDRESVFGTGNLVPATGASSMIEGISFATVGPTGLNITGAGGGVPPFEPGPNAPARDENVRYYTSPFAATPWDRMDFVQFALNRGAAAEYNLVPLVPVEPGVIGWAEFVRASTSRYLAERLADQWEDATAGSSSMGRASRHPAFAALRKLGPAGTRVALHR